MVQILGIVENALAGIACDDLVVLADFLEDLRTDSHLADFANIITGSGNANPATEFADALITREQIA